MADSKLILTPGRHEAVIFDLDGVITRTARLHAAAWKRMFDDYLARRGEPPFDREADYRRYVDGKPRYEGVESFLASRGIALPRGDPGDPPARETVCGLGNRKNDLFLGILQREGAEVFESSIALIRKLRRAGVRTAVVSSSRNCVPVLESVDALALFDAKVDGVDSEKHGLRGKPSPDIFLAAARQLDVPPERTAVVEDALAGVEAGRAGGFALVIGVDRAGQAQALREHGADVVVKDLAEIALARPGTPADALQAMPEIVEFLAGKRLLLFLDYDGTLTPIVERPEQAVLPGTVRAGLRRLAGLCAVAVVSGRDLDDVRERVGVQGVLYAGSHGFDIAGPGSRGHAPEAARAALPELDAAQAALRERLDGLPGALLERKRYGLAVHYRMVAPGRSGEVEAAVDAAIAGRKRLRKRGGKKVFELLPDIDWDKGAAVNWLRQALDMEGPDVVPMYIGDDLTDEDAFEALADEGIGIAVMDEARPTAARYRLDDPEAVERFLAVLADRLERRG